MKKLLCLTSIALVGCMNDAMASCSFKNNDKPRVINFTAPSTINVPVDGTALTVVDVQTAGPASYIVLTCSPREDSGFLLNPSLGAQPATGTVFPLRESGLDMRLRIEGLSPFHSLTEKNSTFTVGTNETFKDGPYRLFLIKNGPIKPGVTIPAGLLGTWVTTGGFEVARFNLLNPIQVVAASCSVSDVNVQMGDSYQLYELEHPGDSTPPIPFKIRLNDCDEGINKIQLSFEAVNGIEEESSGIVSLDKQSTSRGIGLKLTDTLGGAVTMNKTYKLGSYVTGNKTAEANFNAAYVRVPGDIQAGTANTSIRFTMTYQ
ncbi:MULTISPECIES: fimbrial protein [Pseudomonas]|nr:MULTISPECIES: fimbrial protein [Pseudomonas]